MARTPLDEPCQEAITRLDLFDQFVTTDRALEINGSAFEGGVAYGYNLSEYAAPMLLPKVVKYFVSENAQTIKTAEIRPKRDDKGLAKLTLGLSSETQIVIEPSPESPGVKAKHVNRHGKQTDIGTTMNAEIGRFISGLAMPPETRRKLAFMRQDANGPFAGIITDPDFWLLTSAAIQDSADYTILERSYNLGVDETDRDTFLSTIYSGVLSTQQRPDSLVYSLALRGERELYDKMTVADMEATIRINSDPLPGQKKIVTTVNGMTQMIIPGEVAFAPVRCKKPAVANLVLEFLRKATPAVPHLDVVYQRGLPDVPDIAPGVDEL